LKGPCCCPLVGAYFEHFHLDRLYVRSKENLISGLLDGRYKENFTSEEKKTRTSDVKKVLRNNREGNREKPFENSKIRKTPNHDVNVITDYVSDLARELNDEASLPSSVSRALNLYRRADADLNGFVDALLGARAATKQHSASIRKQRDVDGTAFGPSKNRMAYFFAVLEDVLGLADQKVAVEVSDG